MIKRGMTPARIATMALFALSCFGLLVFLWTSFGGAIPFKAKGYRITVPMKEVSLLGTNADVRISGVPVGKVVGIERNGPATDIEIELESRYAPLPRDSRALLRRKTLLGEAYVELTPGSARAPRLPEGGRMAAARVKPSVELDEILSNFDARTRTRFKRWMRGWAAGMDGRARDISGVLGRLPGAVSAGDDVLSVMRAQRAATAELVRGAGRTLATFGEQSAQVDELIESGSRLLGTTAGRADRVRATVRALPPFLGALDATAMAFARLEPDLRPVVRDLRPVARELRPTLVRTVALSDALAGLAPGLDRLLAVAPRGLDATRRVLGDLPPLLTQLYAVGRQLVPMVAYARRYRSELVNSWPKVGAAVNARAPDPVTGNVAHYLRAVPVFPNELFVAAARRAPYSRPNAYGLPGNIRTFETGPIEAFDCSHLGNRAEIPPLGPAPACREQGPLAFQGASASYPRLRPAP